MSPQVEAAIIAASVGLLTVIATVVTQYLGRRATGRDTEKTLDRTLAQQREQLDRTLAEQREQLDRTLAEQRTRTLNERFATASGQLGSDKPSAVRLAGVYAMAGLADDWEENRQTCVDVLCAYLRMPYEPEPGEGAAVAERLDFRASREVRHTVIRVITAHLKEGAAVSWQDLDFDFTGVIFDGGDFGGAKFSGSLVSFDNAKFHGDLNFGGSKFSGGEINFTNAEFSGGVFSFHLARFSANRVYFFGAKFSGAIVVFQAKFPAGVVSFVGAEFSGGEVYFDHAEFSGGTVGFGSARLSGGTVGFRDAVFSGGEVDFSAWFSGSMVSFRGAKFSGGEVDFSSPCDWSCPPQFPWTGTPPHGVKLPKEEGQSEA